MIRADKIVQANGADLCVGTFGDPSDPPILLIGGSSASMDWWEDEFCERLADGRRFVIRYDHRDTGQSVTYEPGAPGYTSDETVARFAVDEPDWSDREAVVDYLTHLARASASTSRPFDEAEFRELAGRVFNRTINMASSMKNHDVLEGGDRWRERLAELRVPTLVIHGTEDPVLPYGNGLALAKDIPHSELLTLEQTGHELPRAAWGIVVPAI